MISFLIGIVCGMGLLWLLQINRDNELKNRINKAIKFIKTHIRKDEFLELNEWGTRDLLNILGGDVDD